AEKVEVQRLESSIGQGPLHPELTPGGDPIEPDQAWIERLQSVLVDSKSYLWRGGKPCTPLPGVRVTFKRESDTAILLLCFECNSRSLARPGRFRWKDSDPTFKELVRLVKEIFPRDPVIQGL